MRLVTKLLHRYSLVFDPTRPIAFGLPQTKPAVVYSIDDWKEIAVLTVKSPEHLVVAGDVLAVSGDSGLGVYDANTYKAIVRTRTFEQGWNDFIVLPAEHAIAISTTFLRGANWYDYAKKQVHERFVPHDESFLAPNTCSINAGRSPQEIMTLVIHSRMDRHGKTHRRSVVYFWDNYGMSPHLHFDVLPNEITKERADSFQLSKNGLLVVSLQSEYRLLGWDVATQQMVFDKKPTHDGLGNLVYRILDTRALIAVGSMGFIDFYTMDMQRLVYSFDTGLHKQHFDRFYGSLTVSPDERFLAVSNGHCHIYELPDSLSGM